MGLCDKCRFQVGDTQKLYQHQRDKGYCPFIHGFTLQRTKKEPTCLKYAFGSSAVLSRDIPLSVRPGLSGLARRS
jgi:hypothetical protein